MSKQMLEPQLIRLPIKVLRVDRYQKRVREAKVKNIVTNFDQSKLGVIHVSMRSDGTYWIFDGQHRVEALRRLGWEYVLCLVFTGMSYTEEASGFLGHHDTAKPTNIEEWYGRREAQDETVLKIESILGDLDLRVAAGGMPNSIQSVKAIEDIYVKHGKERLIKVLKVIKNGFPSKNSAFKSLLLNGIASLFDEYGSKVDAKWLIKKLKQTDYDAINNKADAFVKVGGFNKREAIKMAITQCYNHNKSERLKLK